MKTLTATLATLTALAACAALAEPPEATPVGDPQGLRAADRLERAGGRGGPGGLGMFREDGPPGGGQEALVDQILSDPDVLKGARLTDDQVAALKSGLEQARKDSLPLRTELEKLGLEQARLLLDSPINEPALMRVVEKTGEVRVQLAKLRMKGLVLVKQTLTAEQMEELKQAVRRKAHERLGRWAEERRGGPRDRPRREGGPDGGPRQRPEGAGAPPPPPQGQPTPPM
jgi:Spy/CpxP family protein refolding chaperone